jgi:Ras-related GTP-binding protein C/D
VIDYNFLCFRNAIQQVFELRNKALAAATSNNASVRISANNHSTSPINNSLVDKGTGSLSASAAQSLITTQATAGPSGTLAQNGTIVLAQS